MPLGHSLRAMDFGKAALCRLGGRESGGMDATTPRRRRANEYDAAFTALDHGGKHLLCAKQSAKRVHTPRRLELLGRDRFDIGEYAGPCIEQQGVNLTEVSANRSECGRHRRGICNIAGISMRVGDLSG